MFIIFSKHMLDSHHAQDPKTPRAAPAHLHVMQARKKKHNDFCMIGASVCALVLGLALLSGGLWLTTVREVESGTTPWMGWGLFAAGAALLGLLLACLGIRIEQGPGCSLCLFETLQCCVFLPQMFAS